MIYQTALIEVTDEFAHLKFALERPHPLNAIIRVAEHRTKFFHFLVGNLRQPAYRLLERLVAFGECLDIWSSLFEKAEEVPQARFAFAARLGAAGGRMDGKGDGYILLDAGREALAMRANVLPQRVHRT